MVLNVGREDNNWKILDVARFIQQQIPGTELEFLTSRGEQDAKGLIHDRKIQDGVDKRTYQVSFDKVHEVLPGFQCRWTVEAGVVGLIDDLRRFGLDLERFKKREFYRLQQIEYLYESGKLSEELFWE